VRVALKVFATVSVAAFRSPTAQRREAPANAEPRSSSPRFYMQSRLVEVAGVEPASETVASRHLQAYPRVRISALILPRGGMTKAQLSKVHRARESAETR